MKTINTTWPAIATNQPCSLSSAHSRMFWYGEFEPAMAATPLERSFATYVSGLRYVSHFYPTCPPVSVSAKLTRREGGLLDRLTTEYGFISKSEATRSAVHLYLDLLRRFCGRVGATSQ